MYEEYLEDYVYKLMAKVGSRICLMFKRKNKNINNETETQLVKATESTSQNGKKTEDKATSAKSEKACQVTGKKEDKFSDVDEDLSSLNFHMMMFSMWLTVTLVNVPALLTWARNFS